MSTQPPAPANPSRPCWKNAGWRTEHWRSSLQEAVGLLEHEVAVLRGQMEGLYAEAPAGAPALAEGAWGITQAQAGEGAQGDVLARLPRRSPVSSPTLTRINVP
ncbi:hypothetical protein [Streptomyces sp. MI02-7b]|uniref:hypothetical protein n=1 Tax=Streptomyces sp. MI02-7b TaxID=462941 RepID=UPI0029B22622|nr:hypothetical protein [Streptomyces sp. MI02-7b]MDX3076694.1 hypothetical protein [Streptomyces sp. MI02-7b]